MSWGSTTYLRFVGEASESGALNRGEVVGGSADVREGGVPGGVVDSTEVLLVRNEVGILELRPTHAIKARRWSG
jgi:hypothetical protein